MSNARKITKVKLSDNGLKGLVVSYEKPSTHAEFNLKDEYNVTHKAPVNKELMAAFDRLRKYAVDICCLKDLAPEDVRVSGITSDGDESFVLTIVVRTYGNKEFAVNTPNMKDDGEYQDFGKVIENILDVYKEVNLYIKEKRVMEKRQLAFEFANQDAAKNPDFNPDVIKDWTDEQITQFCRNHLEGKKGAIVIMEEQSDSSGADTESFGTGEDEEKGKVVSLGQEKKVEKFPKQKASNS